MVVRNGFTEFVRKYQLQFSKVKKCDIASAVNSKNRHAHLIHMLLSVDDDDEDNDDDFIKKQLYKK